MLLGIAAALGASATEGRADTWIVAPESPGLFETPGNWSGGVLPANAYINNGGTALIEEGDSLSVTNLKLGQAAGESGSITQTGGSVAITVAAGEPGLVVGLLGSGDYTASGSSIINANSFSIGGGNTGGGTGVMTLSDSAKLNSTSTTRQSWVGSLLGSSGSLIMEDSAELSLGSTFVIGRNGGTGHVEMSGDSKITQATAASIFYIGCGVNSNVGGTGTMLMSDNASLDIMALTIGSYGTAAASQTTGSLIAGDDTTIKVNGPVYLGSGSTGSHANSKGELTLHGNSSMELASNAVFYLGGAVTTEGHFLMDGNSRLSNSAVGGEIRIANGGVGSMTVAENASVDLNTRQILVGYGVTGVGALNIQDNASVSVTNYNVVIAGTGTGSLNMTGGSLTVSSTNAAHGIFTVAEVGGTANINHTGGTMSNNQATLLGRGANGGGLTSNQTGTTTWVAGGNAVGNFAAFHLGGNLQNRAAEYYNMTTTFTLQDSAHYTVTDFIVNKGTTVNFNGGTLSANGIQRGSLQGNVTVNFNGTYLLARTDAIDFINGFDGSELNILAGGLIIDTDGHNIGIFSSLGGVGGLTKLGAGILELGSISNSYLGDTTIAGGTLIIYAASLAEDANVHLSLDGIFQLDYFGANTVESLFIDGVAQQVGTWGAVGSGADFESELFSGSGMLNVTAVPEPGTFVLLALGGVALLVYRRSTKAKTA